MCSTCLLTNYSSIQELRQGLTAPHKHLTLPHTNMKDFSYMMPHPEEHVLPTYNAQEPRLLLPEYGRMVQEMALYALTIDNKDERQTYAEAIVSVMAGLCPQMRDVPDYQQKLWDHLAYMTDYKLDIDYPCQPERYDTSQRPQHLDYPHHKIGLRHYGYLTEAAIDILAAQPEGPERDVLTRVVANRMKRNLADWKGDGMDDAKVAQDLETYTDGRICPDFSDQPLMKMVDNRFRTRKNKAQFDH